VVVPAVAHYTLSERPCDLWGKGESLERLRVRGVEYDLVIDRAPEHACTTLYAEPDLPSGQYPVGQRWDFGEKIVLSEPFGVELSTEGWRPWEK
jgi:hypothetical protein